MRTVRAPASRASETVGPSLDRDISNVDNLLRPNGAAKKVSRPGINHRVLLPLLGKRRRCSYATTPYESRRPRKASRFPNLASQIRVAFASMAAKTGCRSPGELEMTRSTSAVAFCCSRASSRSRRSRLISVGGRAAAARRARVGALLRLRFVLVPPLRLPGLPSRDAVIASVSRKYRQRYVVVVRRSMLMTATASDLKSTRKNDPIATNTAAKCILTREL